MKRRKSNKAWHDLEMLLLRTAPSLLPPPDPSLGAVYVFAALSFTHCGVPTEGAKLTLGIVSLASPFQQYCSMHVEHLSGMVVLLLSKDLCNDAHAKQVGQSMMDPDPRPARVAD